MGSKVLLADDSVTIQKVVGIIFANEEYELTVVDNGDAAVRKAAEIKPDVILVDALMPGKNGYEVCREVRQNPALAHTAILLMTGAFEVVDEEKNRQSGADEFITKPFESQTLIDATNRMISLTAQRVSVPVQRAASQPEPAPVAAPAAPVRPAPSIDDVWATGFDTEPAAELAPEPVFAAAPPVAAAAAATPVKATIDDDLWGAFDMDTVEDSTLSASPAQAAPDDDIFSFEEMPPADIPDAGEDEFLLEDLAIEEPEPVPTSTGFEPVGEVELSFSDDFEPVAQKVERAPVSLEEDFSTISFDEPPPVVSPAAEIPPSVQPVADIPEPSFSAAPVSPVRESAAPAQVSLGEEQLKELLSKVSREVIERIVWEVVPELAENIIKEEIRKLKAGIS